MIEDLPKVIQQNQSRGARTSVSAEAFGNWNKKESFTAPVYEKPEAVKKSLRAKLEQAFMFSALNPSELDIVVNAMQEV